MKEWFKGLFFTPDSINSVVNPSRKIYKNDTRLGDYILKTTESFFSGGSSVGGTPRLDLSEVKLDGDPRYVSDMMSRANPHDEDYIIFRENKDPKSIILDIGANWGYSVGSLRSVGVKGKIVSFEAIPLYATCLQRIRDLEPRSYDFLTTALSSEKGSLTFVVPVVSHMALTALTSASERPHIESLAKNIHHHILNWMPDVEIIDLQFCKFEVPVDTLDNLFISSAEVFSGFPIDVIKIDVEGLEFEVLKGALNVLELYHPLVMAEGGNRRSGLQEFMSAIGYLFAERKGDRMVLIDGIGYASNGFFVHNSRVNEYRQQGILQ